MKLQLIFLKKITRWQWLIFSAVVLVCGLSVWKAYQPSPVTHQATPSAAQTTANFSPGARRGAARSAPVVVARARIADVPVEVTALGTVNAANVVIVRPRVDGLLQRVLFRDGELVKKDQVLAEIDPQPFQIQLLQAQGQLLRDQALLENARIDLQRYQKLLEQDSIATQQVDTQKALVRQYQGAVEIDQAQLDNARLQLAYTRIRAPISGRLGLNQLDAGNLIYASDSNGLVVITQLQPVSVVFSLPEENVTRVIKSIQAHETLKVSAWDRDQKNKLASGVLLTLDNQIDVTTGTIKLKAAFANDDLALFPNQFVNVRLQLDVQRNALVIPSAAVLRGSSGLLVYVVKPDKSVSVRNIQTASSDGEMVVVSHGLAAGEQVVIDGTDGLREGLKVETVSAEPGTRLPTKPR